MLIGLAATAAATRTLQTFLFGISPWDPATYAGAAGVLGVATLVAILLPARRAAAVPPLVALQQD